MEGQYLALSRSFLIVLPCVGPVSVECKPMKFRTACTSLFLGSLIASATASEFAIHNKDRVVFYGDSITDNSPYTTFVETYIVTRYPNLDVRFFNAGVGGDRVTGGWMGPIDQRLPRDLFSRAPSVITVMLGMNDGSYRSFDQKIFDTYRNGYQHIADQIRAKAPNARTYLIQPSPFDDVTRPSTGYNDVLKQYGKYLTELAQASKFNIVDMNTPVVEMLTAANQTEASLASKLIGDRVHPGSAGHLVMAESILKTWGADSIVSSVEIDAQSGKANSTHATVSGLKTGNGLEWNSKEDSLPYPLDRNNPEVKLVLKSSDFDQALNQEVLKVSGLTNGRYRLLIDGAPIGQVNSDDLQKGINLAQWDTPMTRQANTVFGITSNRTQTRYFLWRQIEVGMAYLPAKDISPLIHDYEKVEDDLIRLQHKAAKTITHRFQLLPVAG